MKHVFFDSSVLLSFSRSTTGGAALLLQWCYERKIIGYVSEKVIYEVEKNVYEDMGPEAVNRIEYLLKQQILIIIEDSSLVELKRAKEAFANEKDAPILASVRQTAIPFIISLDKGFFNPKVLTYLAPKEVLTPGDFIQRFRKVVED